MKFMKPLYYYSICQKLSIIWKDGGEFLWFYFLLDFGMTNIYMTPEV